MNTYPHNASDEDLILAITEQGQSELFSILYDRYSDKVYRKCLSFVKDSSLAQDMVQDILLKVFTQLNRFQGKSRFSTWLYAITYNFCVEFYRKHSRYTQVDLEGQPEPTDLEQEEAEMLGLRVEKLKVAMRKLAPEDEAILRMKYQNNTSIRDLMEHLKVSESAVKMRLARARKRVKQYILSLERSELVYD